MTNLTQDMNSAIRVMNSALQEKVKELRAGRASEHPAGLEELQVRQLTIFIEVTS